jgi:hypothetical protein
VKQLKAEDEKESHAHVIRVVKEAQQAAVSVESEK